jgi:hypothetical protein
MTAAPRLRPRPQRPPSARPASPVSWRPVPVTAPPLADQEAAWSSDLGRLDLI